MLTPEHEAIIQLLRERPQDIPQLIRQVTALPARAYTVTVAESVIAQTVSPALTADLVAVLSEGGTPAFVAIVEYQRRMDLDKRWAWPMYVAMLHRTHKCPVCVLALTRSATVAAWAREPIVLGPGSTISPLVLGPNEVRKVSTTADAVANPVLAVLSGLVHGDNPNDLASIYAAFSAVNQFQTEVHRMLNAVLFYSLSNDTQEALNMQLKDHPWANLDHPLLKTFWESLTVEQQENMRRKALQDARQDVEQEVRQKVEQEIRQEVRQEVEQELALTGARDALRTLLTLRGIALTTIQQAALSAQSDRAVLAQWFARAAVSTCAEDIFTT